MAVYHVGCNLENNVIYAGTVNKKQDKWLTQTEVTDEALLAVRNHFLKLAEQEQTNEVGYRWTFDNNKMVTLKVVIEDVEESNDKHETEA